MRSRAFWPLLLLLFALAIGIPIFSGWLSEPAPNGSLLEGGAIRVDGALGIPAHVIGGPLAPEGSHWQELDRALVLGNRGGSLSIELAHPVTARALLVQAMAGNRFEVEASLDGERWQPIWTVAEVPGGRGMRTRHQTFDPRQSFRFLRVRNPAEAGIAALGALRAYAEIPGGWPLLGPPAPAPISDFPWFELATVTRVKSVVAVAGALLLVAAWWLDRRARDQRLARAVTALLGVAAAIAALGWWNFFQISSQDYERTYYNYWDANHYYLGAKYAPELGYTRLYRCMLAADVEAGLGVARLLVPSTRDLSSNGWVPTRDLVRHPEACTDRFEADRWQAFQVDQAGFRSLLPARRQLQMLMDHGYNGSPVWGIFGSAVGGLGPADDFRIAVATALDPILLVASFALIWIHFGFRATCGALILFGTSYSFGNWFTAGAFLRFGWFAASVAGVCCLKRERWFLAGLCLALAMSLRLFPGFLIGGVGLHALIGMIGRRRLLPEPHLLRFATAVAVGVIALGALSSAMVGDVGIWKGFLDNSIKHRATSASMNIGVESLKNLFDDANRDLYETPGSQQQKAEASGPERALSAGAAVLAFGVLALAVRREDPWVCAILGLCWLPFASGLTFYYYSCAILFALLSTRAPVLTLPYALLIASWGSLGLAFDYLKTDLYAWSSLVLVVYCSSALICFATGRARSVDGGA
jgi:hypothetical protein